MSLPSTDVEFSEIKKEFANLPYWDQIDAGPNFCLAIRSDNTLWAWGINNVGQLGTNDRTSRSSPVQIGSLSNWAQVAAGRVASFAIKTDGSLWTWGYEIASSPLAYRSSPVQVGTLTNWFNISSGFTRILAVKTDGTLWAWGDNTDGQLGNNSRTNSTSPIQIGSLSNWAQVASGSGSYAVKRDGTLWAWGYNYAGMLGLNDTNVSRSSPVQVGSLSNWARVSTGIYTTHAIKTDNSLWGWGYNTFGEVGDGTSGDVAGDDLANSRSSPVQIGALQNWSKINGGGAITGAIKADGTLWMWGRNVATGQGGYLGDNSVVNRSSPVQIGSLTNWFDVKCGWGAITTTATAMVTLATTTEGYLWSWGYNVDGLLADGTKTNRSSPVQIGAPTTGTNILLSQYYRGGSFVPSPSPASGTYGSTPSTVVVPSSQGSASIDTSPGPINVGGFKNTSKGIDISVTFTSSTNNVDLLDRIVSLVGQVANPINCTVTIGASYVLSSTSTAVAALNSNVTYSWPAGSKLTIYNYGDILGDGGDGGDSQQYTAPGNGTAGGSGGPALITKIPTTLYNFGNIWAGGGGGGGGGGGAWFNYSISQWAGGGGGGAGGTYNATAGIGVNGGYLFFGSPGQYYSVIQTGLNGTRGSTGAASLSSPDTTGGTGGVGYEIQDLGEKGTVTTEGGAGGNGGNWGLPGTAGATASASIQTGPTAYAGGLGGAGGYAIQYTDSFTLGTLGNIRGNITT